MPGTEGAKGRVAEDKGREVMVKKVMVQGFVGHQFSR